MAYDRYLIAPLNSGLQTDLKSWMIAEDALEILDNAYIFRGRLRKRVGSVPMSYGATTPQMAALFSRLRIALSGGAGVGTTDGAGAATGTVPGAVFKIGQQFSIGTEIFTVVVTGAPGVMKTTGASTTMTYNTTTGAYVFAGATPTTQVYFYPAEPVMGITQYETQSLNNNPTYAFDTQFAYIFAGGSWARLGTGLWHRSAGIPAFFWASNWNGLTPDLTYLFVSNFQVTIGAPVGTDDAMKYWTGAAWTDFTPIFLGAGDTIRTARIILPFKDRLVLLNTIEQNAAGTVNTQYPNRCRFSHNGSPIVPAPGPARLGQPWLEPNQTYIAGGTTYFGDGGGYVDAPTEEEIVSAQFIKDRLIVYFERSTWELAYTGNYVLPFVWQKLNTELGSTSTFSSVPFDKEVLTIGTTGVHSCNGSNVARIDTKIPDSVFSIRNSNYGVYRIAGIRDYFAELVYWIFPTLEGNANANTYPNKLLVYNYRNNSWAMSDDCFTAFGYYEQQLGLIWANATMTWQQALFTWNSGINNANFKTVIAGDQEGFVVALDINSSTNAIGMSITNIAASGANINLTIVDHTLQEGDYIKIENALGFTALNNNIYQINIVDANTITIGPGTVTSVYTGGGTIRRVSYINILTKRFNPYAKNGMNVYLAKVDFAVQKTTDGELVVDYYPSSTDLSMVDQGTVSADIMGSGVLETSPYALKPLENIQTLLWHPVYFQTDGEFIQLNLYLNDDQMTTPEIVESGLEIEGFVLYTMPVSRLG